MSNVAAERMRAKALQQAAVPDDISHQGERESTVLAAGLVVLRLGAAVHRHGATGLAHAVTSFQARIYALAIAPVTPGRWTSRVSSMSM